MKITVLLCTVILFALNVYAQQFDMHWVSPPIPDSTSHIWYRQSYLSSGRHRQARLTVSTTGYFKLYVNESNVGTAAFYPYRDRPSCDIATFHFDVTPYLRRDTNTIAIVYAPAFPHLERRQISVTFYGRDADNRLFAHHSDQNWLCRQANSSLKPTGGEHIDGRKHSRSWKSTTPRQALWVSVVPHRDSTAYHTTSPISPPATAHIVRRREPQYFDIVGRGVDYLFQQPFYGSVRLTLREAKRGSVITFGNTDYVCSGRLDEQAFPIFSLGYHRRIGIHGDASFRQDQIVNIESLETIPITPIDYKD